MIVNEGTIYIKSINPWQVQPNVGFTLINDGYLFDVSSREHIKRSVDGFSTNHKKYSHHWEPMTVVSEKIIRFSSGVP